MICPVCGSKPPFEFLKPVNCNFCLAEAIGIGRQLIGDGIDIVTGQNPVKLLAGERLILDIPIVQPENKSRTIFSRIKQRILR